jgi:hypothetical protein
MNSEDTEFARAMTVLAAEHHSAIAPRGVEMAVLAEFDATRRRAGMRRRIAAYGAIAAMAVFGALAIRNHPVQKTAALNYRPPVQREVTTAPGGIDEKPVLRKSTRRRRSGARPGNVPTQAPAPVEEQPFFAIPYTVPLAPGEHTAVVRMTLSDAAFAAVGFPAGLAEPAGLRQADVLVGEDGRARAIRIVADSSLE